MDIAPIGENKINQLLQFVPSSMGEAVIITDLKTNVLFMNGMAEELTGYSEPEVWGRTIFDVFGIVSEKINKGAIFRFGDDTSLITGNGKKLLIGGSISAVKNEANEPIGLVIILSNITEQRQLEKKLQHMSTHDALTGLYNRTWFENQTLRIDGEAYASMGIIVCDIDGLKIINDTMGHKAGDAALISTAKLLKECSPEAEGVARIGGDEFTILLPGSSGQMVREVCDRIKLKISNHNKGNSELPLSVSLGFCVSTQLSANVFSLFQEADNNMYKEKLHHKRSVRSTIINTIMHMIEVKERRREGHSSRLENVVELMAISLNLSEDQINDLCLLAKFHDIGKVGISDRILLKTGSLTTEETEEMQRHCEIGHHIATSSPDLSHIANWILKHHEWWNGKGYPQGLKGEAIPFECRILSILDAYDAMTNDRSHHRAMSQQEALSELKEGAGTQFDPILVFEFTRAFEALKIYVASSVEEAMLTVKQAYIGEDTQSSLLFRFGGSGKLKEKIDKGALVDIFVSAAPGPMDDLQMNDLIVNDSRENLLRNRIVLITSKKSKITTGFKELGEDKIKKIAIGDPDSVPAGKYAQEVLTSFGISEIVKTKLVFARDVHQVLNYVEIGDIDVGIVYQTDANLSDKVKILDWAPDHSHTPVVYPVAIMKAAHNKAESEKFMEFLTANDKTKEIFEKYGFIFSKKLITGNKI